MFRNQYDNDVTVWSPQGRIHQLEYAMEAVKQGSAAIGIRSQTHAVLVALKRAPSELSAHQKKILPIDDHIAVAIVGLTADARLLCDFMRSECLESQWAYEHCKAVSRLVADVSRKSQIPTQRYGGRPFGVGLLIAGYDGDVKYHDVDNCMHNLWPLIHVYTQSGETVIMIRVPPYAGSQEELVKHGLRALRDTLPSGINLNTKNCSLGVVGKDMKFKIYDDSKVAPYLALVAGEEMPPTASAAEEGDQPPAQPAGIRPFVPVSAAVDE